jgi:hypothetical protein
MSIIPGVPDLLDFFNTYFSAKSPVPGFHPCRVEFTGLLQQNNAMVHFQSHMQVYAAAFTIPMVLP